MKNFYSKSQLSWSKNLLATLYNFSDNDNNLNFFTNAEIDFLGYLILRNKNVPDFKIEFIRSEILKEVFDNRIDNNVINKIFKKFNVVKAGSKYQFTYGNLFLYNRLPKSSNNIKYVNAPYGSIPIETWLKIQQHNGKFTRRIALYLLLIENDFPVKIKKLKYRVGMYERKDLRHLNRDFKFIIESLKYLKSIKFIKDFKVVNDKLLIQYKGVKTFDELSGQVQRHKNYKEEKLKDDNDTTKVNKALSKNKTTKASKQDFNKDKPKSQKLKFDIDISSDLSLDSNDSFLNTDDFLDFDFDLNGNDLSFDSSVNF